MIDSKDNFSHMLKANLILDGKKQNNMNKEFKQITDTLHELDADVTKLEELFNDLEAEYIQLQADFTGARAENYIKALQIEKLRDENTHLKNQIKP